MSNFYHPLWPDSPEATDRSLTRRMDQRERKSHGPWHNAGDPGEPTLDPDGVGITAATGYLGGVGARWRRRIGGGCEPQIAVDGGSPGDIVVSLGSGWYLPGEGNIPLKGHDSTGALRSFYADSNTGDILVGAAAGGGTYSPNSAEQHLFVNSVSIAAGAGVNLTWSHYAGTSLMDITTVPTQPRFQQNGVFAIDAAVHWAASLSAGIYLEASLNVVQTFDFPPGSPPFAQSIMPDAGAAAVGIASVQATLSRTVKVFAADSIFLRAFNADSVAHTVDASISVCRIIQL